MAAEVTITVDGVYLPSTQAAVSDSNRLQFNLTRNLTEHEENYFILPYPEWKSAKAQWGPVWYIHVYGFAAMYASQCLLSIVVLLLVRRRALVLRHLLPLGIMLILFGSLRACYFFIDPYQNNKAIPTALSMCMLDLAYPCLCYAFSLVIYVLMRITRVHIGPKIMFNHVALLVAAVINMATILVVNVVVSHHWYLKHLLLLCQTVFITWMLLLCFSFVYGGFKMTQFSTESENILKQVSTMKKLKQEQLSEGNKMLHFLQRIKRPRLHLVAEDEGTVSCGSESSMSGSESLLYLNEAYFDSDINPFTLQESIDNHKDKPGNRTARSKRRIDSNGKVAKERDSETNGLPEAITMTSLVSSIKPYLQNGNSIRSESETFLQKTTNNISDKQVPEHVSRSETPGHASREQVCDRSSVITDGEQSTYRFSGASGSSSDSETEKVESGYLADTEVHSPRKRRKQKGRGKEKHSLSLDNQSEKDKDASPVHKHCILPSGGATVSLCRIRQGRVLQRVLRVTYLSTLMAFTCCVLQLYSMFGVYGVLSHVAHPDPWQWLMFKTVFRLAELGLTTTMCLSLYFLGRGRSSRRRRKNKTTKKDAATVC